jgi:hypothetical protein
MPALKNPRHEAFAQAYVRGEHAGNATASYRAVYGKDNRGAATRMQQKSSMVQRVAEIRDEMLHIEEQATDDAAKKLGITKEWVLEKLVDMVELPGKRKYEASVAQRALELIGKHFSMFIASDAPNVNVNVGVQFVDHPPAETRQEWEARRRLELAPKANGHANGNGKGHS